MSAGETVRQPVQFKDHPLAVPGVTCELCGKGAAKPVREHCHEHGWVRGITCQTCNVYMGCVDRRVAPAVDAQTLASLVAFWHRCPDCGTLDVASLAPIPQRRITVDLPDELHAKLRLAAYLECRSVSAVIRDRLASSLPELPEEGQ